MRIAIVGLLHHPIAEPFAGGMESHTWWLAKKLIERGHEVTLFASGDSDQSLGLSPCIERAFATHPHAQTIEGRQACNTLAYANVIRQICKGSFDIVHNNALHPFLLLNAADLPTPMLMVLHTPPYKELAAAVKYASMRNSFGQLKMVAVSQNLATQWQSLISVGVIYNGIDVQHWPWQVDKGETAQVAQNTQDGAFQRKAIPNKTVKATISPTKTAFWYGRFVPEKAPHLAIQAALLAGYTLHMAGPVSDRTYFDHHVAPLIDHQRIVYLGHLSQEEIQRSLAQASVLVNTPIWDEPYGLVYAEALASGTPVATFSSGATSEILTPKCGVVVKERTATALAQAICKAAQLSRIDCRQRAMTFCHIDTMVDGYEYLYRQLIEKKKAQTSRLNAQKVAYTQALLGIAG
jgi:UDP-glucose:tetrahydrobiopterin glucosyltransferase